MDRNFAPSIVGTEIPTMPKERFEERFDKKRGRTGETPALTTPVSTQMDAPALATASRPARAPKASMGTPDAAIAEGDPATGGEDDELGDG